MFLHFLACRRKDPDPYKYITDPDADLRGPKTYGSESGTGTLIASMQNILSYVGTEV
jgi:hypothetical protein